jgi:hypothetical protein
MNPEWLILHNPTKMMTAIERKQNTEKLLETLGIPIPNELPPIEEEAAISLRDPREIAERILVLTYLNCVAVDNDLREEIIAFLKHENLWDKVSEVERELFDKTQLSDEEATQIVWRGESIWMLLWVINKVNDLGLPVDEVNLSDIFVRLPEFMKDTKEFLNTATIRPLSDILDQSDLIFRINWAMRQAHLDGSDEIALNQSIAYERYHAINWVTSVRPQWDEI